MKSLQSRLPALGLGLLVVGLAIGVALTRTESSSKPSEDDSASAETTEIADVEPDIPATEETESPESESQAAEEQAVGDFEQEVERWREPTKADVQLKDIADFVAKFKRIPPERQDECVHHALNLIPDENAMLLVGLLMDRSLEQDVVEAVFNDVLNRDESVKKPILLEIYKDKKHPCWTDVAWILDVTGETPGKQEGNGESR